MRPLTLARLQVPFLIAAMVWAAWLPVAAWAAGREPFAAPTAAAALPAYWLGHVLCHQRPDRSFHWAGTPWPVCARCTGIYAGAALTAVLVMTAGRRRERATLARLQVRLALAAAAVPTLATLAVEMLGFGATSNAVRAAAGLPLGVVIVWLVVLETDRARPSRMTRAAIGLE